MALITDLYQEYLHLIGKLKDVHNLTIEVEHKDIHTFYKDKQPLFKLFYGKYAKNDEVCIVVSFHLDLIHAEAISWFISIYNICPILRIHDSYIEDDNGETYLGEDALALQEVFMTQNILDKWLKAHSEEEMREFADAKVVGKKSEEKTHGSPLNVEEAIIEFDKLKKPPDDEEIH